ncbi:MAG: BolA family transcriptional regulator [Candidatus Eremiobacteraeota bacterium]|nr:BolA family transcriptional regulator [Candidatus Eremiobacteraeota bacterium]
MSVQETMEKKLTDALNPTRLVIDNVSHQHAGHRGSPGTGESHFNALIVSPEFEGKNRVARYRLVHQILADEMAGPVHALSLDLKAPSEI